MYKPLLALLVVLLSMHTVFAQEKLTISGYVKDAKNGEALLGATVFVPSLGEGVSTNDYGFYSLTLPKGTYELSFSYISYQEEKRQVKLDQANVKLDLEMKESALVLETVTVSSERVDENVRSIEMSVNKVDMRTIQKMPALLGEVDVIRSIQFLPGVTTVGEGATGFNVRGGNIDQNLVLLDEAPVFNSSHLFGFFSVFNPDAVKDVKLIKGGIPAEYGGRLSSILDVRMKEGNSKKFSATGGIGTIFSRLAIETPIVKDRGSLIIAGRRSYIDVLAKPFLNGDLKGSRFYFYDLTAKANYRINDKNTVFLSGYFGRDVFGADFGFDWGNTTASARWNHVFSDKLFLNTTAFFSNYDYRLQSDLKEPNPQDAFRWNSNIKTYSVKPDFTYYVNSRNKISFGGQMIYYTFQPGKAEAISGGETRSIGQDSKYAIESALYIGNEQKVGKKLTLQYGLRYSLYDYIGPGKAYTFGPQTGERRDPISEKTVQKGESIAQYGNWEPRFSANLGLGESSSLKLSYNRMAQYLHLLSNTAAASPLDVWTPTSNNIKPQLSDQFALGFFKNLNDNLFETSVEVYYKSLQNQVDYIPNSDLLLNPRLEGDLLYGDGRAYGAEFFIKKIKGKLNGWISYTLSRTERQVEGLNNDNWFPSRFDKTHVLNVVGIYDVSQRLSFSVNFTYGTGTPATYPTSKFVWQGFALPHNFYDERNGYRIPDYHRVDLAATLKQKKKLFGKGEGEWVFSIYNVYNRRNAFSVYVRQNANNPSQTEAVRYSVFGSIIPAVTYNFKF
ncbi:TonB-dependent receptor [Haliscomenobacter hydrossis]|uniref:TonB-dependent receptor plug n=1 Tax=Haliscomenobacter hydrossis (strain ATCC 27775 / DSM 1100 / LMG 10767 / O) TaxID=760192 RepID=F4L2E4_HALH1|nr:TonB-dependent receptor [Haliscomenobacter hydrossis]AEE52897.1 TonB-dependent receptor plug [Haliscomenobacter hydrossis DSM 1100]